MVKFNVCNPFHQTESFDAENCVGNSSEVTFFLCEGVVIAVFTGMGVYIIINKVE